MVIIRCVVILFCLLLSSCTKHKSSQQKNNSAQALMNDQGKVLDIIVQQEAMLVDVAIPMYDERIVPSYYSISESDTLNFGYKSPLACAQAQAFFMSQMERYGWQHLVSFNIAPTELLLQFSSPYRYCTVIIKNDGRDSFRSCIFIYIKKISSEDYL